MMSALEWSLLLLLVVANGTPILAQALLGERFGRAVDGGRRFADGRELFGGAKRWRGLLLAPLATMFAAAMVGIDGWLGLQLGALAMVGDLFASFIKRRLAIETSGRAPGLDQIPEALLPLWLLREALGLAWGEVILLTLLFMLFEMAISPLLHRLKIRSRPY